MRHLIALCALTLFASPAFAQVPRDPDVGIQLSSGAARFSGDLSNDDTQAVVDLQIETLFVRASKLPLMGYLAIDALFTSASITQPAFPFKRGEELQVRAFLFIPHLCVLPSDMVLFCGGIGQGTVNVNGDGNRRDYGTWNYQTSLRFFPYKGLSVGLLGKYVGRVEQQVNGKDSQFTFMSLAGSVGWWW